MSDAFFRLPILNSPYDEPSQHWELDANGKSTSVVPRRRLSALVSPIPTAKKVRGKAVQEAFLADETGQEFEAPQTSAVCVRLLQSVHPGENA